MALLTLILVLLAMAAARYAIVLVRSALAQGALRLGLEATAVGAVVNFFDTLGIGSFAPTMAWLKIRVRMPDRRIPCTLIVACTLPTIVQAGIFLVLLGVHVDTLLLVGYSIALLLGGLFGSRVVRWAPIWIVQGVVAAALLIAAALYAASNLHLLPAGGLAASLPIPLVIAAVAASFVMGVLLNFGIGHYAPSLLMFSLMGMDPRLVFPIMATGGALAATVISARHIKQGLADIRIALGFAVGGAVAVAIAALIVKNLPVELLRWLVIVVVVYAATVMLRDALATLRSGTSDDDVLALAVAEGLTD
ncbi:TSUP family transporter [Phenylobacterium sp.]|uniref:TSUP family transporter n=1 Tax=Phenylobacterium sp. TaxID=1871053 RepID=UPI002DEEAE49|nr:TSUP family transporter [Phenylobacterium sp.]